MKAICILRLIHRSVPLLTVSWISSCLYGQTSTRVAPDCFQTFSFVATGVSGNLNNIPQTASGTSTGGCSAWIVSVEGFNSGAGSVTFQQAPSNAAGTAPGSYVTFVPLSGTTSLGSNPRTSFPGSYVTTGYAPWLRVSVTVSAGTIRGTIQGWRSLSAARSGGGSGGSSFYQTVADEGTSRPQEPILNFAGAGVTCVDNAGATRTDCTIPGGGGSAYATIQNAGTPVAQQTTLNFVSGVTCANNGGASRTDCTVTPGTANYQQSFTAQTSVTLAHNLNTTRTLTQCYDGSNVEVVPNTTTITSVNVVTVTFLVAQTGYCNVNGSGGGAIYHYQYFTSSVSQTTGSPSAFITQFNTQAAAGNGGPAGPAGGFLGYGVVLFPQAGAQAGFVAHIPSTWDGSSITLDMDTILDTGSGNASLTPYSACRAIGANGFVIPYNAGSNVLINNPGGTTPTETYNLVVPITGCSPGNLIYIAFARPATDTLAGNIYLLGGNLGIKY